MPKNATPEHECDVVHCSARGWQMSEEDFPADGDAREDACVEVYMFMRAAVIEWEEDVEREQVRLEERCKAVAAAVKEHGVDGAVEIFRFPTGREEIPKGRERGGSRRGGRGCQAESRGRTRADGDGDVTTPTRRSLDINHSRCCRSILTNP